MKLHEILTPSFRTLRQELGLPRASKPVVQVSADSDFCHEVVAKGWLTEGQMAHAAERYRLGRSKSGRCIFWMIDEMGRVNDGFETHPLPLPEWRGVYSSEGHGIEWVSAMLKAREPALLKDCQTRHCLFGTHLINVTRKSRKSQKGLRDVKSQKELHDERSQKGLHPEREIHTNVVAVVESERSAVVLSELLPQNIWMASVYPMNLNVGTLQPLCGHRVVLFPPTDETGETFLAWLEVADQARRVLHLDISVSAVLEERATEEEKRRRIDILEFMLGSGAVGSS